MVSDVVAAIVRMVVLEVAVEVLIRRRRRERVEGLRGWPWVVMARIPVLVRPL